MNSPILRSTPFQAFALGSAVLASSLAIRSSSATLLMVRVLAAAASVIGLIGLIYKFVFNRELPDPPAPPRAPRELERRAPAPSAVVRDPPMAEILRDNPMGMAVGMPNPAPAPTAAPRVVVPAPVPNPPSAQRSSSAIDSLPPELYPNVMFFLQGKEKGCWFRALTKRNVSGPGSSAQAEKRFIVPCSQKEYEHDRIESLLATNRMLDFPTLDIPCLRTFLEEHRESIAKYRGQLMITPGESLCKTLIPGREWRSTPPYSVEELAPVVAAFANASEVRICQINERMPPCAVVSSRSAPVKKLTFVTETRFPLSLQVLPSQIAKELESIEVGSGMGLDVATLPPLPKLKRASFGRSLQLPSDFAQRCPLLTEIELTNLPERGLDFLRGRLNYLTTLVIRNYYGSQSVISFQVLQSLQHAPQLKIFAFCNDWSSVIQRPSQPDQRHPLEALAYCPLLESITLCDGNLVVSDLAHLSPLSSLQHLEIGGFSLDPNQIRAFLPSWPRLKRLIVKKTYLEGRTLEMFRGGAPYKECLRVQRESDAQAAAQAKQSASAAAGAKK